MIELFRKRHNLTQKKLASMIGYGDEQVSRWENGAEIPIVVQLALEALEARFLRGSKVKWRLNLFQDSAGNPHVGDGEPFTQFGDSLVDASRYGEDYHATVCWADGGIFVMRHNPEDIAIAVCEKESLPDGFCNCGQHEYNHLDSDIGRDGWVSR